ncbi:uncharacterized protein LOC131239070 [Magnolia sinica]|uniref:uncharacterized protein LOC131239070 n=1 Tax=Magnolia sinica TaxID=86752 RepID=UPI0026596157|nr:uncharacterized protein LOC131239070 [Magnolia sinica]
MDVNLHGCVLGEDRETGPVRRDYIARFNEEALQVEDYDDKMALSAIFSGLKEEKFAFSIKKKPPKTSDKLITRAQKYANAKEFSNARKSVQVTKPTGKGKRPRNEEPQTPSKGPDDRAPRDRHPSRKPEGKFHSYTPFNTSTEQIFLDIQGQKLLNWPVCMNADPNHRDKCKYCHFHRDHDHNTTDCMDLKDEIKTLIRKGHLRRYTKEEKMARKEEREQSNNTPEEPAEIRTIFCDSSSGGDSNRARKAYFQKSDPEHYIHVTERPSKELRASLCSLTLTEDGVRKIQHPHDDALMVTMTITNHKVYRILVDTGSSADMIYSEAFERMGIPRSRLRPVKTPLHGFTGKRVISEGVISLPVTTGEGQHQATLMVDFLVVNVSSLHNIILGRPSLNAMRAVVSVFHLMMKFPAEDGTGYLRGEQREAPRCYAIAVKKGSVKQALTVNILDPKGPTEDSSVEDLEKVSLDEADPNKTIQLGTSLSSEQQSEMLTFLRRHKDVFA